MWSSAFCIIIRVKIVTLKKVARGQSYVLLNALTKQRR